MTEKYKSKRPIDGKSPIWVIVDEDGKIISRNPTKEELKYLKVEYVKKNASRINIYNETNTCPKIKKDGTVCGNILIPKKACRERDKNNVLTERWICDNCYRIDYSHMLTSNNSAIRSMAKRRTKNLTYPNHIQGDKGQELSCILLGALDLNIVNDNYKSIIDNWSKEIGYFQTQCRAYDNDRRNWPTFRRENGKTFKILVIKSANEIYKKL